MAFVLSDIDCAIRNIFVPRCGLHPGETYICIFNDSVIVLLLVVNIWYILAAC